MITKEKSPLRALFFRDHEISGLEASPALLVSIAESAWPRHERGMGEALAMVEARS
jgi:hypothetical protein